MVVVGNTDGLTFLSDCLVSDVGCPQQGVFLISTVRMLMPCAGWGWLGAFRGWDYG